MMKDCGACGASNDATPPRDFASCAKDAAQTQLTPRHEVIANH